MTRRGVVLAVLMSGTLWSGCTTDHGVLRSGDSIVLVGEIGPGDSVAGVGLGGTLAMVGDCVGIDEATVIWPYGTEIASNEPLTIDVPGLGRVALGDQVDGSGDEYVDRLPKGIDSIPAGCPAEQVFAFYPDG